MVGGVLGGIIGGVLGATAWALVGYLTGSEAGWIAIGVGLAVGIGVAVGARRRCRGHAGGILAAAVTVGAIVAGKYGAVYFSTTRGIAEVGGTEQEIRASLEDDESMILVLCGEVVDERLAAGEEIDWPTTARIPARRVDFPTDVWDEAESRWNGASADARSERREQLVAEEVERIRTISSALAQRAFQQSFGWIDAVFFGIGMIAAYKIAGDQPRGIPSGGEPDAPLAAPGTESGDDETSSSSTLK